MIFSSLISKLKAALSFTGQVKEKLHRTSSAEE
jgi:hypothetical protein